MDKNYVEAMIRFLENVSSKENISCAKGENLCGAYWPIIRKELDKDVLMLYEGGAAYVKYTNTIPATLSKYRGILSEIQKAEDDRELDNLTKRVSNKYAKRAYRLSIVAIIISLAAVIVEILSKTVWRG